MLFCFSSGNNNKKKHKNNRLISTLHNKHHQYITEIEAKRLKTYIAVPPRIFGQMKIHKPDRKLRPVVSTINSASYKLSKFLANIMRRSFRSNFALKNSVELIKKIKNTTLPVGYKLISFDVTNCFTNISTQLALKIIEQDFDTHIKKTNKYSKKRIYETFKFLPH